MTIAHSLHITCYLNFFDNEKLGSILKTRPPISRPRPAPPTFALPNKFVAACLIRNWEQHSAQSCSHGASFNHSSPKGCVAPQQRQKNTSFFENNASAALVFSNVSKLDRKLCSMHHFHFLWRHSSGIVEYLVPDPLSTAFRGVNALENKKTQQLHEHLLDRYGFDVTESWQFKTAKMKVYKRNSAFCQKNTILDLK